MINEITESLFQNPEFPFDRRGVVRATGEEVVEVLRESVDNPTVRVYYHNLPFPHEKEIPRIGENVDMYG